MGVTFVHQNSIGIQTQFYPRWRSAHSVNILAHPRPTFQSGRWLDQNSAFASQSMSSHCGDDGCESAVLISIQQVIAEERVT